MMIFNIKNPDTTHEIPQFSGTVLGDKYGATTAYLTKNGRPYICRMGEVHYSRLPENRWEEALVKMKEGGIDVIASYVFWIHHEEVEGEISFEGNLNIGKFLSLCKKHALPFVLRIGPWVHGEAKNGGFPDWIYERSSGKVRTDNEAYLSYVRRFFERVYIEIKDYSDVILGIQLENELRGQVEYVRRLKEMLLDIGFSAPYFTFTGWGGSDSLKSCPPGEVLCLYGGYPEGPWYQHVQPFEENCLYSFFQDRDPHTIGVDILQNDNFSEEDKRNEELIKNTPYLTCELGGGNQVTYHRRPIISTRDVMAVTLCRLGSGANGLGYYVYHGGVNPTGKTTTMQESRASDYPNDLPIISYDFQAPLGEAGQIRESYYSLQALHRFIELCGEDLAKMPPCFSDESASSLKETDKLRAAVRSDGKRGFVFVSNHARLMKMQALSENITVNLPYGESLSIPVSLAPGAMGIIPFNLEVGGERISWLTALPQRFDGKNLYLSEFDGITPKISISGGKPIDIFDGCKVGNITLRLLQKERRIDNKTAKISLSARKCSAESSFFAHIINYDGTKPSFPNPVEYEFAIPKNAKYLRIRANGNIGAIYHKNELIADYYFYGVDWFVDVRNLPSGALLKLLILPLTEEDKEKIYFEVDMPSGIFDPEVYAIFDNKVYC